MTASTPAQSTRAEAGVAVPLAVALTVTITALA